MMRFISLLAPEPLSGSVWLPPQASTLARETDSLFYFIYYVCVVSLAVTLGTMVYFIFRYRHRHAGQKTSAIEGNRRIEIAWAVIPSLIVLAIFAWGFRGYLALNVPPGDALEVRVTAQKWFWSFDYPKQGLIGQNELVVPIGKPVKLVMSSRDVIHSFYVPYFRIKRDVIPNRYSVLWFEATHEGTFDVFCTEYCGSGHSHMLSRVRVLSAAKFEGWLQNGGLPPGIAGAQLGQFLFAAKGCVACHSATSDRQAKAGPPLAGVFGRKETLASGESIAVDDNYVRESLMDPMAKVLQGYAPVMPTFKGQITDKQIDALIDYLKTLK